MRKRNAILLTTIAGVAGPVLGATSSVFASTNGASAGQYGTTLMGVRLFGLRHLARQAVKGSGTGSQGIISTIIIIAVVFALWYLIVPRLLARRRDQQHQQHVDAMATGTPAPEAKKESKSAPSTLPLGVSNREEFIALAKHIQAAIDQRDRNELTRYTTKQGWAQLTHGWADDAETIGYTELTFDQLLRESTNKDELHIRATITSVTMPADTTKGPEPAKQRTALWELQRSDQGWVVNRIRALKN